MDNANIAIGFAAPVQQETSTENLELVNIPDGTLGTPIVPRSTTTLDLDNAIYIVFDLETTGFSQEHHSIIKIACLMLDSNGDTIPKSMFSSLVKPPKQIPPHITNITGISNETVDTARAFEDVGKDFLPFLKENIVEHDSKMESKLQTTFL
jgi:DNA polymerase III epsilon subunit-like protein